MRRRFSTTYINPPTIRHTDLSTEKVCTLSDFSLRLMAKLDDLPHDLWYIICDLLPLASLFSLRRVCKNVNFLVSDRSIWHRAVQNASLISPIMRYDQKLSALSSTQLLNLAAESIRLDSLWHRNLDATQFARRDFNLDLVPLKAQFLPGGQHIAILYNTGEIHIHRSKAIKAAPLIVLPPCPLAPGMTRITTMKISLSSSHEPIISTLTNERFLYAYKINCASSSAAQITSIRSDRTICHFAVDGDFLLHDFWHPYGRLQEFFVQHVDDSSVRKRSMILQWEHEKKANTYPSALAILSPKIFMLANFTGISLFSIPEWSSNPKSIAPFWTSKCGFSWGRVPKIGPVVWNGPGGQHVGLISIRSDSSIVLLSPSLCPEKCRLLRANMPHTPSYCVSATGSRRTLWTASDPLYSKWSISNPHIPLQIATFFRLCKGRGGIERTRKSSDDFAVRTTSIELRLGPKHFAQAIHDLSWDESSGYIAVLSTVAWDPVGIKAKKVLMLYRI